MDLLGKLYDIVIQFDWAFDKVGAMKRGFPVWHELNSQLKQRARWFRV